jgi:N-methylhydantoinase A
MQSNEYRIGADIGGTFTDVVLMGSDGSVRTAKLSSTPDDYSVAIIEGITRLVAESGIQFSDISKVVHGTTVATNTILEGKGAKTALITTAGFRDVLEIARTRYARLFDINTVKLKPLVRRQLRFEAEERIGPQGEVRAPLDESAIAKTLERIRSESVEALAICLLHSYANPAHEQRIAEIARSILSERVFITCSSDVLPEIREYERTSTTVINAYLGPVVADYVASLSASLRHNGIHAPLQIMQSSGGIMSSVGVSRKPATIVESGPAAGVIGAARVANISGYPNIISLDLGGTTAKASIVEEGGVSKSSEMEVGGGENYASKMSMGRGHALKLPAIDISEVGAGGGSLVSVDKYGRLLVGPRSAGAAPGPVCYGLGGEQTTLTDALVILGYLNSEYLVGGEMLLNLEKASLAMQTQVAEPLAKRLEEAAHGIVEVAAVAMMAAVRSVSTNRGRDPRDFDLFAFGGTGPVLATELAGQLGISRIIVPANPGLFSAFGLLHSNIEYDYVQTFLRPGVNIGSEELEVAYKIIEDRALAELAADGYRSDEINLRRQADLQYAGQAFELKVSVGQDQSIASIVEAFEAQHEFTYGHRAVKGQVNLVSLRLLASVVNADEDTASTVSDTRDSAMSSTVETRERSAYFGAVHGFRVTPVITRGELTERQRAGPLIVEEYDSTVVIPPGWTARVDDRWNVVIEVERET